MPRPIQISGLTILSLAPIGKVRRGPGIGQVIRDRVNPQMTHVFLFFFAVFIVSDLNDLIHMYTKIFVLFSYNVTINAYIGNTYNEIFKYYYTEKRELFYYYVPFRYAHFLTVLYTIVIIIFIITIIIIIVDDIYL